MDFTTLDDQALLRQIIMGQEDALAVLYDRYGRLVFSVAWQMVHDYQSAEEITLDVFDRAWRSGQTYRPDRGSVSTWLAGMARNRAIDLLRRESVRPEYVNLSWANTAGELPPRQPEATVASRQEQEWVRHALAQLPSEQREVLALAYFGGYSHRDIAQRLQQPLGTVKTRLRLAMQKMRDLLESK